ncbi:hypothetical protein [Parasitella parasitica]|uniref:Uncharacterized protein n=1 Tax=Parasitella parasitica TaxID=35722 RepID=A0A0B7NC77_9FUNG|nr:hypothetical protein [Parasitella parasitica]
MHPFKHTKWRSLPSNDKEGKQEKPVVVAFGAAQFWDLRGNVPAPTKVIRKALNRFLNQRRLEQKLSTLMNSSGAGIFPVKKCSSCNVKYNRDHMAAMNIRSAFLYMVAHGGEDRPELFVQPE